MSSKYTEVPTSKGGSCRFCLSNEIFKKIWKINQREGNIYLSHSTFSSIKDTVNLKIADFHQLGDGLRNVSWHFY